MLNINSQLQEIRSSIIWIVLIVVTALIGLTWISVGINSYLTSLLGPVWGPIALGGICFIPIIIFALIKSSNKKEEPPQQPAYGNPYDPLALNIPKMIESLHGQPPIFVTIVTIISAFLATRFPSLLTIFTQIVIAYTDDLKARVAKAVAEKEATDAAESAQAAEAAARKSHY
jgi:hypothetical protein